MDECDDDPVARAAIICGCLFGLAFALSPRLREFVFWALGC